MPTNILKRSAHGSTPTRLKTEKQSSCKGAKSVLFYKNWTPLEGDMYVVTGFTVPPDFSVDLQYNDESRKQTPEDTFGPFPLRGNSLITH